MNWKGHIAFGIVFVASLLLIDKFYYNFFFPNIGWITYLIYTPLLLMSFLLPDIDHQISKVRLVITLCLIISIIGSALTNQISYVIILSIILLSIWILFLLPGWHHRGHAHSIIFIAIVSALVILLSWKIAIVFFFGAFSHLIADGCIKIW